MTDRDEISDLLTRLDRLLDEQRWDDAGTIYTDDATVHSPRGGTIQGLDALIAFLRASEVEGVRTQHTTAGLLIDLDGDRARTSANAHVHFFRDGQAPHRTSGLRLDGLVVRTPAGWRLRESRISLAWTSPPGL
jgi:hypothetical protein